MIARLLSLPASQNTIKFLLGGDGEGHGGVNVVGVLESGVVDGEGAGVVGPLDLQRRGTRDKSAVEPSAQATGDRRVVTIPFPFREIPSLAATSKSNPVPTRRSTRRAPEPTRFFTPLMPSFRWRRAADGTRVVGGRGSTANARQTRWGPENQNGNCWSTHGGRGGVEHVGLGGVGELGELADVGEHFCGGGRQSGKSKAAKLGTEERVDTAPIQENKGKIMGERVSSAAQASTIGCAEACLCREGLAEVRAPLRGRAHEPPHLAVCSLPVLCARK